MSSRLPNPSPPATNLYILIVTNYPSQAKTFLERFKRRFGDVNVEVADSALYALTRLERDKPDLIVSGRGVGDMRGLEFYNIVRADASLNEVLFILLDSRAAGQLELRRTDVLLDSNASPLEVLRTAFKLLTAAGKLPDERETGPNLSVPITSVSEPLPVKQDVSRTLEVQTLTDLILSVQQSRSSGKLYLVAENTHATIFFDGGRLIHASIGGLMGERAVLGIFSAAQREPTADFYFETSSGPPQPALTTVRTPVDELLMRVTAELGESGDRSRSPVDSADKVTPSATGRASDLASDSASNTTSNSPRSLESPEGR